ncbi:MAG: 16S rRNA (guanine(966)-N(2))-methyltransferase RsmD [Buchnera aphidicola (Pentalonia nigronervosa)]|jgi:16S rRNA (guanine966-N2)-methyltransferase|uniref:Ribosomal RNA small subunit methyltransferase D n=1 Tax=Buchnera aphidicola (Pentalonia nigronervosa) TaxID=1309793 RepID=A0A7H1AZ75_9GAMM|nr:MAG: 16S rRNA (guanine(966)-N(2))-methyltransferase RsmD [Buchnera aphidicola (Pentalonia nigronervosa)]
MHYHYKKNRKIYIISGKLKKRNILFTHTSNLRPTMNHIRETLFNWLSTHIKNARCLDCFAGSGILGIEAISRYAAFVTLLEINKKTILQLKKNSVKLNIKNLEIIKTNTLFWLKKIGQPYDIIFIDPPYDTEIINKTIFLLEYGTWLKNNSLIYIEKNKKKNITIPQNWILYKKKISGQTEYCLYVFKK